MASETRPFDSEVDALLTAYDPPPATIVNPDGRSPFLLIGDHAGNRIPERLGDLGLSEADRVRHIAWDIGVAALGEALAKALDAPFVRQTYSRLVIDCNRAPDAHDAIASRSDGSDVPGNITATPAERAARVAEIHAPYHTAIAAEIARRDAAGVETILVALHSFTPVMGPAPRPWQIGVLHDRGDASFALACLDALRQRAKLTVGDNEPYRMDGIDYTIPRHAYPGRRRYVETEIRQDLLSGGEGIAQWTELLSECLETAYCARLA